MEIARLFMTKDEDLYDKKITDVFGSEFFASNFWLYWRTMFAFEDWHSALEMKLYIQRFIHHIGGLPDFSALKFTKFNQYESLILPMVKYLEAHNVPFPVRHESHQRRVRHRRRQEGREAYRVRARREKGNDRSHRGRSCVRDERKLHGKLVVRRQRPRARPQHRARRMLGSLAEHRAAEPGLRPSREILRRRQGDQLGIRDGHDARREDPTVHREDLQTRSVLRQGRYRRHRDGEGFCLAFELDAESPARTSRRRARTSSSCGCTASIPTFPAIT